MDRDINNLSTSLQPYSIMSMTKPKIVLIPIIATSLLVLAGCTTQVNPVMKVDENLNSVINEENNTNSIVEITPERELLSSEELVWLEGSNISVDSASFEILNSDLAKDARAVYSKRQLRDKNNDLQAYIDIVDEADPATITIIQETYPLLAKDKDRLFIRNYNQRIIPINEIDISTFQ